MKESLERYFLGAYDHLQPSDYRKIKLQFYFLIISMLFAGGYFANTFFTDFIVSRYLMLLSIGWFFILLMGLKWRFPYFWISQLFILSCWNIIFILSLFSEGIHSDVLPWLVMVPVVSLVLSVYRFTWMWVVICIATVIGFYLGDGRIHVPKELVVPANSFLTVSLHVGLILIMLLMTYLFEVQQQGFIEKIEKQNEELRSIDEELRESVEELSLTQERLAEKEAESRSIVEALREHFFITEFDLEGNIIFANKKVVEMTKSEPIGLNRFKQMDESIREDRVNDWKRIVRGESSSAESKYEVEGHQFWVMSTYAPIQNRLGKVSKIISVAHEITETKKREQEIYEVNSKLSKALDEIKKMNSSLELRVQERTLALEEKNKHLAEYAFINSHLLRGPLCRLLGLVELLNYTDISKADSELLSYLKMASLELDTVVSRINSAIEKGSYFDRDIISGNLKSI